MLIEKWLVCGSRKDVIGYRGLVFKTLDEKLSWIQPYINREQMKLDCIIEGECLDSADIHSKAWAKENNIAVKSFPSEKGKYLKRNIEMVKLADEVIAFWDGFSYGTAHTISQAILQGKSVDIITI